MEEKPTTPFILSLVAGVLILLGAATRLIFRGMFAGMMGGSRMAEMMGWWSGLAIPLSVAGLAFGVNSHLCRNDAEFKASPTCNMGHPHTHLLRPKRVGLLGWFRPRPNTGHSGWSAGHRLETRRAHATTAHRTILHPMRAGDTHRCEALPLLRQASATVDAKITIGSSREIAA